MSTNLIKTLLILNAKKGGWSAKARIAAELARKKRGKESATKPAIGSRNKPKDINSISDKELSTLYRAAVSKRKASGKSQFVASKEEMKYSSELNRRKSPGLFQKSTKPLPQSQRKDEMNEWKRKDKLAMTPTDQLREKYDKAVMKRVKIQQGAKKAGHQQRWEKAKQAEREIRTELLNRSKSKTPVESTKKPAVKMSGGSVSGAKHVHSLLKSVAQDNGMSIRKDAKLPANAKLLEQQAKKLSTAQKEILAVGEFSEQQALVKKYKVKELSKFLNEAFDGKYSQHIFGN